VGPDGLAPAAVGSALAAPEAELARPVPVLVPSELAVWELPTLGRVVLAVLARAELELAAPVLAASPPAVWRGGAAAVPEELELVLAAAVAGLVVPQPIRGTRSAVGRVPGLTPVRASPGR
jgi:hypothetical protein